MSQEMNEGTPDVDVGRLRVDAATRERSPETVRVSQFSWDARPDDDPTET
jgi:hypothetical protein